MNRQKRAISYLPDAPSWSTSARLIVLALLLGVGLWLLNLARPLWWLIILAFVLAYLLQPLIHGLTRLWVPRSLAALLSILLALALVVLVPIIVIPVLFADLRPLSFDVVGWLNRVVIWVQQLPQTLPGFTILDYRVDLVPIYDQIALALINVDPTTWFPQPADWFKLVNDTLRSTASVVGLATNVAYAVVALAFATLFGFFMLVIFSLYLARDLPLFLDQLIRLVPAAYQPEWRELWRRTGRVWNSFFRGQILLSLVVGIAVWGGLAWIGVPGALALGIIAAIFEVLPNVGPVLALIPAGLIALLEGSTRYPDLPHLSILLAVLVLYLLIQQLENYVLVPRILGDSVGVHAAWVLLGVLVFALQFGILGAFVAAPVLATLQVWAHYAHARIMGEHPYPELLAPIPPSSVAAAAPPTERLSAPAVATLTPPPPRQSMSDSPPTIVLPRPADAPTVDTPGGGEPR